MKLFNFKSTKLHIGLAVLWTLMLIPTLLWWKESILWVSGMSLYALVIGHVSSWEAARSAGVDDVTHARLQALAEGMADIMEVLPKLAPGEELRDQLVTKLAADAKELRHVVGLDPDTQ